MNGLSDLELVAQAMDQPAQAPPNQPSTRTSQPSQPSQLSRQSQPPPQRNPNNSAEPVDSNGPTQSTESTNLADRTELPDLSALGIDLSSLTPAELAAVQPIIDALVGSDGQDEDEAESEDDLKVAELLRQMDAAGMVADDLEGKLDLLLRDLGETEREFEADLPGRGGAERAEGANRSEKTEGPAAMSGEKKA